MEKVEKGKQRKDKGKLRIRKGKYMKNLGKLRKRTQGNLGKHIKKENLGNKAKENLGKQTVLTAGN